MLKEQYGWSKTSDGNNKIPGYYQIKMRYSKVEYAYDMCAIYLDTDKEREIKSGIRYPFPRLNEGECIIHKQMADTLHVDIGHPVFIQMDARNNI